MNIFGVGGAELVLIFIIMLVVAGPKRMLRWAYIFGQFVGKLRDMWQEVMAMVQAEIDEAGMDIDLPREMPTRRNIDRWTRDQLKSYTDPLEDAVNDTRKTLKQGEQQVREGASVARETVDEAATQTDLGTWGDTQPDDSKPTYSRRANPNAVSTNGNASSPTANDANDTKPPARLDDKKSTPVDGDSADAFGAWSQPKHPGKQQSEQEA